MDSLITAAARALAAGDLFGVLNRVALRNDAPALALRGMAMARLGDFAKARALLKNAARAFGPREAVARARCVVAEAEIALVSRDLQWPSRALEAARHTLEAHGDAANAAHARYLDVRRSLLLGRLDEAEHALGRLSAVSQPPVLRTTHELIVAGIATRRLDTRRARAALERAREAARLTGMPELTAEVETATRVLDTPAARRVAGGAQQTLRLGDVEALFASKALVIDACRYEVRESRKVITLARRPVLFTLARALAEAWPRDVARGALVAHAFRVKHADESLRARLRVEMGRLRRLLRPLAEVRATQEGFALLPRRAREGGVLARPVEEEFGEVLAFLSDGEAWSSSALALALGLSQRNVQRALNELAASGKVRSLGHGRARRWLTPPVPGFTTTLLLPAPPPAG